jgi:hypothetical protein
VSQVTRWLVVGALVGGGVLSAAVARALPGRSTHTGVATTTPTGPSSAYPGGEAASPQPLAPPPQAPREVPVRPVVNSGGS